MDVIYFYLENINVVSVFVHFSLGYQKSQRHDILALGVIWANLKHDETQFLNFSLLRILQAFFRINCTALSHHHFLSLMKFWLSTHFGKSKNTTKPGFEIFIFINFWVICVRFFIHKSQKLYV